MRIEKGKNDRVLFLDKNFVNSEKTTANYCFAEPTDREICCSFDDDWDREACFFTIVKEDGFYRMYYDALNRLDDEGKLVNVGEDSNLAAIESKDGITWTKPNYGLVEFNGSKNNNIIKTDNFGGAFVYKDTNPACRKEERYKALYTFLDNGTACLKCSFSSDGLTFGNSRVILKNKGTFDSMNVVFWDENQKKYVCYFRNFHNKDGSDYKGFKDVLNAGNKAIRDIRVMYSEDFITWTEPQRLVFDNDYDYQLYTNNIIPYYRAKNYYIGFPSRYIERQEWNENYDNLCSKKVRQSNMQFHPRLGLALTDDMFISSSDGINFNMSTKPIRRPGIEREFAWLYGADRFSYGHIETVDIFGANKELSLYYDYKNPERVGKKLMRCTYRIDGFTYYEAEDVEKVVVSNGFSGQFDKLFFNMSTSVNGYVKVILRSEDGKTFESIETFGDSLDKEIIFKDDISVLKNKNLIMEIYIKEAKIYSVYFK